MATKKAAGSLQGGSPEKASVALLLIDVINDLDFPNGPKLLHHALPAARRIAALKKRIRKSGVPVIYVNDNFGRWQSDFRGQVRHCLQDGAPGAAMVRLLLPEPEDYFVLKPKHSGFFSTSLEILLKHLGVKTLVLTGFAADICVLYTANDAYMRDYSLIVPHDCVASETRDASRVALQQMKHHLHADIRHSSRLRLRRASA
ncbi:nicotinamidase-related amidase [Roseimicrobium gellanilyticum]|uniref:Nicotinamidase-related amidase n=1 Tax=Roseimicrobium gellanilyticum TaxID=748857 RepID=A0A366HU17_9BACT|nr:isochorismatase family cysteine hydrolase [Roseimicrobium gellanilyticum]RBP47781.1 nicotinamidase-related amidase [Roseimicrobium gellanilyticum]